VHRQLPDAGARQDPAAVRPAQRGRRREGGERLMAGKYDLDIVFVNPASRTQVYQSLGKELAAVEPPVWAALLAGACRARGLAVAVLDAEAEGLPPEETAERVRDLKPVLAVVVV